MNSWWRCRCMLRPITVPSRTFKRSEERRCAMPLVVMGHRAGAALLQRQAGLGAVERLDLALLVDREHDGVRRRVEVEPDHVTQFLDEPRIVRELELPDAVRLEFMGAPDALDRTDADAGRLRHHRRGPVGRLDRRVGQGQRDHPFRHISPERRDARWPRLVAQESSQPLGIKRACQRQTQVFDLPVRRMIATVPRPSALSRTISARQTCFWAVLRSRTSASRRRRSVGETSREIPVRMHQTCMPFTRRESPPGLDRQTSSTRLARPILVRARTRPLVRMNSPMRCFWSAKTCSTPARSRERRHWRGRAVRAWACRGVCGSGPWRPARRRRSAARSWPSGRRCPPRPRRRAGPEVAVDGAARREIPRQYPPLATGLQQVEHRVHHSARPRRPRTAAGPRSRKVRRDQRPFPIRHHLRRLPGQPRPRLRLFGRLFRSGRVRRDGRGQRLRVGRTPRRRLLGDQIRSPSRR